MSADYTPAGGARLTEFLAGVPVESRWLVGHHVVWTTGQQDRADGLLPETASHCSAFVAAIAQQLGVYVLRPPNKNQELLANAQYDWLHGEGGYPGPAAAPCWESLGLSGADGVLATAVARANAGQLVLAAFAQPRVIDPETGVVEKRKPGHIAIVRPQDPSTVGSEGPTLISAGDTNYRVVHMQRAFAAHAGAWPSAIALFAALSGLETDSPEGQF